MTTWRRHHHRLQREPSDKDPSGQLGREEDSGRHRQEGDAGEKRRETLHVLEEWERKKNIPYIPA